MYYDYKINMHHIHYNLQLIVGETKSRIAGGYTLYTPYSFIIYTGGGGRTCN